MHTCMHICIYCSIIYYMRPTRTTLLLRYFGHCGKISCILHVQPFVLVFSLVCQLQIRQCLLEPVLWESLLVWESALVQIFHPHLPDSNFVGDGAADCLDEIQPGDEDPSTRLQKLTERIEAEFPPEEILLVCPRGWSCSLTEHALCELRRWRRRAGRFRSGTKRELAARQAKRQARIKRIYKILGFKKIPARCR